MSAETTNSRAFMLYRFEGNGADARWTKIGAAWTNRDGKGFNILCDVVLFRSTLSAPANLP